MANGGKRARHQSVVHGRAQLLLHRVMNSGKKGRSVALSGSGTLDMYTTAALSTVQTVTLQRPKVNPLGSQRWEMGHRTCIRRGRLSIAHIETTFDIPLYVDGICSNEVLSLPPNGALYTQHNAISLGRSTCNCANRYVIIQWPQGPGLRLVR